MYYIFLAFISFTFVGFSESWNEQKSTTTIINKREVREKEKVFEKTGFVASFKFIQIERNHKKS